MVNISKIPTENDSDIANCLIKAADIYGVPDETLHDLSERMFNACEIAFPANPHRVIHYHFYLHRRVLIVYDASQRLLSSETAKKDLPKAFLTSSSKLKNSLMKVNGVAQIPRR